MNNKPSIYFASDSLYALQQAIIYGQLYGIHIVTSSISSSSLESSSLSINNNTIVEPLHLDKTNDWKTRNYTDFDNIFIDLYLLGISRCISYGMGGYGKLASYIRLYDNNDITNNNKETICSMIHMTAVSFAECPRIPIPPTTTQQQNHDNIINNNNQQQNYDSILSSIFLPIMPMITITAQDIRQVEGSTNRLLTTKADKNSFCPSAS